MNYQTAIGISTLIVLLLGFAHFNKYPRDRADVKALFSRVWHWLIDTDREDVLMYAVLCYALVVVVVIVLNWWWL